MSLNQTIADLIWDWRTNEDSDSYELIDKIEWLVLNAEED